MRLSIKVSVMPAIVACVAAMGISFFALFSQAAESAALLFLGVSQREPVIVMLGLSGLVLVVGVLFVGIRTIKCIDGEA
ncbi:hypothetical protein [Azospirillum argentinense]|uniref:Uncharacterized protein n=1 Tax=Azospirillum brasilense TaxID=192 RepID=A0A4D8QGV5_AZOBR|nr:hypothetical protein [Azospirillum argentinense]QCO07460.1 hypothetical protein D3867_36870 [Azospirillum argentinense]